MPECPRRKSSRWAGAGVTHTQEVNEDGRFSIAALVERGWLKPSRDGDFLYINNRLEGNALMTVFAVLQLLKFVPESAVPKQQSPAPAPRTRAGTPQLDLGL